MLAEPIRPARANMHLQFRPHLRQELSAQNAFTADVALSITHSDVLHDGTPIVVHGIGRYDVAFLCDADILLSNDITFVIPHLHLCLLFPQREFKRNWFVLQVARPSKHGRVNKGRFSDARCASAGVDVAEDVYLGLHPLNGGE
jgi:hypothetical protein